MNLAQHAWEAADIGAGAGAAGATPPQGRGKPTCAASNGIISTGCATPELLTLKGHIGGSRRP